VTCCRALFQDHVVFELNTDKRQRKERIAFFKRWVLSKIFSLQEERNTMSPGIRKCSVLVVGAGPSGLFLADELNRQGVDCRLIDKSGGPCGHARATAIQPRTLEILEQVGLVNEFLAWGVPIRGLRMYAEGNRLISEQSMTGIESPFPFKLSLPQSRTERLLIDQLESYGQAAERNLELVSFEQDAGGVRCALRSTSGVETTVDADCLKSVNRPQIVCKISFIFTPNAELTGSEGRRPLLSL